MSSLEIIAKGVLSFFLIASFYCPLMANDENRKAAILEEVKRNYENEDALRQILPILGSSPHPNKYENILLTQLRNRNTSMVQFRALAKKIGEILVCKVVECLETRDLEIETPICLTPGEEIAHPIDLVSIMRSGDALLDTFMEHFPDANVSKILIQRDEETAKPNFKYMKLSPTIASGRSVVITEPMIATGGTLDMVIKLLKEKGVREENIIIASVCTAPEGLVRLYMKYPGIKVVMNAMDSHLNEKKYIVPGLGDFGDRFFGTTH